MFASATAFYYVEKELNEFNFGFLSSYYWAISIATTTGNADIFPKTEVGMYIAILLMFLGSLFLWSYTALFAATLVLPVMRKVRRDVSSLGSEVREIEKEVSIDVKEIIALRKEIESLKKLLNKN
ncbi:MAG: potassium channel family protein [Oligoflexia bacterium]|nr:potassium channel family protein [Oligoflexia bacterium]